jgi:hypothetical protein
MRQRGDGGRQKDRDAGTVKPWSSDLRHMGLLRRERVFTITNGVLTHKIGLYHPQIPFQSLIAEP